MLRESSISFRSKFHFPLNMKCEVLEKTGLVVEKGSIVEVTEKQFELARRVLKPIVEENKEEKPKKSKK